MFRKILSLVIIAAFVFNEMAFALSPQIVSGDTSSPVRESMHATGQKLFAIKKGPGSGLVRDIEETMDLAFTGKEPMVKGIEFVKTADKQLPDGWQNNPILSKTNLVEAFKYFRDNEARIPKESLDIREGYFEVDEANGELPIARIESDGDNTCVIILHTKFVQMWNHIRANDILFKIDNERTVSLAWGIFYRVAKHEMADRATLFGRQKGGGHLISYTTSSVGIERSNEISANRIGGNYNIINDGLWMWFLGSYCFGNATRYDQKTLESRLRWFFGKEGEQYGFAEEFPNLCKYLPIAAHDVNREFAISVSLAVNYHFFKDRPNAKIPEFTVNPQYIEEAKAHPVAIEYIMPATGAEKLSPAIAVVIKDLEAAVRREEWIRARSLTRELMSLASKEAIPVVREALKAAIQSGEWGAGRFFAKKLVLLAGKDAIPALLLSLDVSARNWNWEITQFFADEIVSLAEGGDLSTIKDALKIVAKNGASKTTAFFVEELITLIGGRATPVILEALEISAQNEIRSIPRSLAKRVVSLAGKEDIEAIQNTIEVAKQYGLTDVAKMLTKKLEALKDSAASDASKVKPSSAVADPITTPEISALNAAAARHAERHGDLDFPEDAVTSRSLAVNKKTAITATVDNLISAIQNKRWAETKALTEKFISLAGKEDVPAIAELLKLAIQNKAWGAMESLAEKFISLADKEDVMAITGVLKMIIQSRELDTTRLLAEKLVASLAGKEDVPAIMEVLKVSIQSNTWGITKFLTEKLVSLASKEDVPAIKEVIVVARQYKAYGVALFLSEKVYKLLGNLGSTTPALNAAAARHAERHGDLDFPEEETGIQLFKSDFKAIQVKLVNSLRPTDESDIVWMSNNENNLSWVANSGGVSTRSAITLTGECLMFERGYDINNSLQKHITVGLYSDRILLMWEDDYAKRDGTNKAWHYDRDIKGQSSIRYFAVNEHLELFAVAAPELVGEYNAAAHRVKDLGLSVKPFLNFVTEDEARAMKGLTILRSKETQTASAKKSLSESSAAKPATSALNAAAARHAERHGELDFPEDMAAMSGRESLETAARDDVPEIARIAIEELMSAVGREPFVFALASAIVIALENGSDKTAEVITAKFISTVDKKDLLAMTIVLGAAAKYNAADIVRPVADKLISLSREKAVFVFTKAIEAADENNASSASRAISEKLNMIANVAEIRRAREISKQNKAWQTSGYPNDYLDSIIGAKAPVMPETPAEKRSSPGRPRAAGKSPSDLLMLIGKYINLGDVITAPKLYDLYAAHYDEFGFEAPAKRDSALRTIERDLFEDNDSIFAVRIVRELLEKGPNGERQFVEVTPAERNKPFSPGVAAELATATADKNDIAAIEGRIREAARKREWSVVRSGIEELASLAGKGAMPIIMETIEPAAKNNVFITTQFLAKELFLLADAKEDVLAIEKAINILRKYNMTASIMALSRKRRELNDKNIDVSQDLEKDIIDFTVKYAPGYGPGSEKEKNILAPGATTLEDIYKSIALLSDNKIEILIPGSIGLTETVQNTLSKIRQNKGEKSVICRLFNGEEHLKDMLSAKPESGVRRIVISDSSATKTAINNVAESDARLFRGVRLLSVALPEDYNDLSKQSQGVYQADIITRAVLVRLLEKNGNPFVRSLLKNMITERITVNPDAFIDNLIESENEAQDPTVVLKRIQYCLNTMVNLVEKIGEQLVILRSFVWTAA